MWNVPVDHEMFNEITTAQWLWYFYNFSEDHNEAFVHDRDMTEYAASFTNPEAVKKIRDGRDNKVEIPDDQFSAILSNTFGRTLSSPRSHNGGKIESVDPRIAIQNYKEMCKSSASIDTKGLDYKHWISLDSET